MSIWRVFQVISVLIGIIAFVTGKDYIGDVNPSDMGEVFAFIFSIIWASIKLALTYGALVISLAFSMPAFIIDLVFNQDLLSGMWGWSWNEVAVDWFWEQTEGIKLFFAFLMSGTIGFFFEDK